MTFRLRLDPRAEAEIADAARAYEATRAGYGRVFLSDIDHSVALLVLSPGLYQVVDGPIRRAVLRLFPFNLYYRIIEDEQAIHLIACVPGRTDPALTAEALRARSS